MIAKNGEFEGDKLFDSETLDRDAPIAMTETKNHEQRGRNPSIINGVEKPGIVHRLDKDTSGVIIIAKNDRAMHALQLKIAKRTIQKTYLALVIGKVKDQE